jgi:hypothetical protein
LPPFDHGLSQSLGRRIRATVWLYFIDGSESELKRVSIGESGISR